MRDRPENLYLVPIGGTAMASLAGLLQEAGHRVQGVDGQLYPPMSTLLEDLGIPVRIGYDPDGIPADIHRVIIGNAVPRSNPEVQAILERGLPYLSQAEAVAHYLLAPGRRSMVVAGTHGKTTTASLLAWIMESVGSDPSYLVGGMLRWSRRSFRLGRGPWMVIEGDEYNTAFFDRGPKFLHYRPEIFLLGPVDFDHADIYRDLDAVLTAFRAGTAQVPASGAVVVNGWSDNAVEAARAAAAETLAVGPDPGSALQVSNIGHDSRGSTATLRWHETSFEAFVPLAGRHNVHNAAMALAAALHSGVAREAAVDALSRFPGVARRMEIVGETAGITVVDDFAHHPTALTAIISAARERWPGRRLVIAYEPRSLSASRKTFQADYTEALAAADVVMVAVPYHRNRLSADEILDREAMGVALEKRSVLALMPGDEDDPVEHLVPALAAGDVVIGCSSGNFGDFHRRLLKALRRSSATISP